MYRAILILLMMIMDLWPRDGDMSPTPLNTQRPILIRLWVKMPAGSVGEDINSCAWVQYMGARYA